MPTTTPGGEEPTNSTAQQMEVVNSALIGRVKEFVPGSDWKHYVERMEMFFEVNNVLEAKKVPTILILKDPSQPRLCFCLRTENHDNQI